LFKALGYDGHFMLVAFVSLAVAVLGVFRILISFDAPILLKSLPLLASVFFIGAGVFKLDTATTTHVVLIALAFILVGLLMFLSPVYVDRMRTQGDRIVSWGLGGAAVLFASMGHELLPIGLAQRLVAGCIIMWMVWLSFRNISEGEAGA
jgi:hypothetical protein